MNPNRYPTFGRRRWFGAAIATLMLGAQTQALTTHLLVRFEGTLDGTDYTLGPGEIDTTGTFSANGSPTILDGQAQLDGSGVDDVYADGFRLNPETLGPLTATHWVAEAVVAFDHLGPGLSTVIDVQGDTDFRFSRDGRMLEATYWDGKKTRSTQTALPDVRNYKHLALVWDADERLLSAYINGESIGTVGGNAFIAEGGISFGYLSREGVQGRGIYGILHAVSFAISDRAILPSDFLINRLPPDPPQPPPSVPVDPWNPSEQLPQQSQEWARWLPKRIRQLEAEQAQLLQAISVLPQHRPVYLSNRLGYHSRFEEVVPGETLPPNQIEFFWEWGPQLDSIALAPAFNPKEPGAYAFPRRFRIDVRHGKTNQYDTVVDWMDEDFPDPGLYPVFFAGMDRRVSHVRITIPQVERISGMAYSALGEVFVLQSRPDGTPGANMTVWGEGHVEVEGSESLSMPPLWDFEYLHDGLVGLGFPLSDETVNAKDLVVVFEGEDAPDEVQFLLDLGQVHPIGRIDFWPAAPPAGLALPSFGFPEEILVELSPDPEFRTIEVLEVENGDGNIHRENVLSVAARAYKARYLRVTLRGLTEHEGQRILGLGEISVTEFETILSANCKVSAKGIPEAYRDQLPRLVDECSWQRRILPVGEWIKGLAQRRPLDRRLVIVKRELTQARADWLRIKRRLSRWAGAFAVLGLIGGLVFQRQMRRRSLNRLKWRIARDLHDEVGSTLGSISLTAEQLEHLTTDEVMREELDDLSLMAREACVSLREVVWVIDQSTIRLPELVDKLAERARRVIQGIELDVVRSAEIPPVEVSLPFKRHLVMFFKEAVHNCVRHAQATVVEVVFDVTAEDLRIVVRDNGCGFDSAKALDGCGLDNMRDRAREMGGVLAIASQPGEGTSIKLVVPLRALTNRSDHHYKTSN